MWVSLVSCADLFIYWYAYYYSLSKNIFFFVFGFEAVRYEWFLSLELHTKVDHLKLDRRHIVNDVLSSSENELLRASDLVGLEQYSGLAITGPSSMRTHISLDGSSIHFLALYITHI